MAGARIKDISGSQTLFDKDLVLLVDRIDTGSGDWLQARKIELGLLGNTYVQGSSNGINWHDELLPTDTYFRFSSDGGNNWLLLDSDGVREGNLNLYYTDVRVSANSDVAANTAVRHTHSNLSILENLINTGTGNNFLADDGTYKSPATVNYNFTDLLDTPSSYTGHSGKTVVVNGTEDGLEFIATAGTGTVTSVTSLTTNQLTVSGTPTIDPQLSIVTASVTNGSTALATGDQIYDFVTGLGYLTSVSLQDAYDGSTTPEILTDVTRGALSIKRGSTADTDSVLEVQNGAGTNTVIITGSGEITAERIVSVNDIDVGTNITVGGTVDGRDVALDGSNQDSHIADSTIHFTEASIDHTNILNIGTNTHAQIDTHIANSNIHFTQASISITASQVSDFDTEVSNNVDVAANIASRHTAVTVTDSSEIDFTLTGQNITASLIAGSIDETKLDTSVNASLDLADTAVQPGDLATVATSGDHTDLSNIGINTHAQIDSHISGTGADHTYINQDVTTTGSPNFTEVSLDGIKFDINNKPSVTPEGTIYWNGDYYTPEYVTGLGPTIKIGQSTLLLYYNNTGSTIAPFKVLHLLGGTDVGGVVYPTPELADASMWEKTQGTLSISTHEALNGEFILTVLYADKIIGGDTSGVTAGSQLWLSADGTGSITDVKPEFPNYSISVGGAYNSAAAPNGQIFVNITKDIYDTFNDSWDGAIRETFDFRITSNGTVITGSLENADLTNDLTLIFSDGFYTFDTTPAATLSLTPGTATIPQLNYVFIDKATKTLQTSTSGFPILEHAKVAKVAVLDAVTTQNNGALRNQNINDHIKSTNDNGHILHIAERVRQINAEWDNGTEATLTGTPTNVYINTTAGEVWQMHKQSVPVISMPTDGIYVVNEPGTPYDYTTNLNTRTQDASGGSLNNQWASFVIWGIANKSGEPSSLMCNLPLGTYNSEANAIADSLGYSVYDIPTEFKGVGFLIARFTLRVSSGSWTYNSGTGYQDLRGFIPNATAGTGAGSSGITTFTGLTDTPSSYTGSALKVVRVNAGETSLEFATVGNGDVTGPASAVNNNLVAFDGTTGKLIKDSGLLTSNVFNKSVDTLDQILDGTTYKRISVINDIPDVVITTPANNELLAYDSGSGDWINQTAAEAGLALSSDLTSHTGDATIHFTQASISITASQVSDFDVEVSNNTDVSNNTTHRGLTSGVHGITGEVVGTTDIQTLTNKTLTSPTINNGSITTPTLTLKQSTTPTPTVEGDIQWDTDNNQIKIGDGVGTKIFSDDSYVLSRSNHTGTQTASTISDFDTEVSNNVDVSANTVARHTQNTDTAVNASVGSGILLSTGGTLSTITNNSANWDTAYSHSQIITGNPHQLEIDDLDDVTITTVTAGEIIIRNGTNTAWVNNTFTEAGIAASGDLISHTGDSTIHFTQASISITASQVSDFDTEVSNNTDVAANTSARHDAVTLGTANGLSLATQQLSLALASTSTTGALSSTDWNTFNNKQSTLTFGIADTNSLRVNQIGGASDNDYAKFTASGIEGRSIAEVKTDLSLNLVENTALSTWTGSTNLITVGTISTGTWQGNAIGDSYLVKTGNWVGTFDGQEGSYYLNYNNFTNTPDLSVYALKTNVLELDNTDIYNPTLDYHPATKKYVDDNSAPVDSVFGRTGVVVAQNGDYSASQVTNAFDKASDSMDDISDGLTYVKTTNDYTTTEKNKLSGIETGAEVNNISDANATDLTDGLDSSLHYHSSDRNRSNHTGTQTASTISDFDTEVSNNTDVTANTSARHSEVTLTGTPNYITITGQQITRNLIDLTTDVTGQLPDGNIASASTWDDKVDGPATSLDNAIARFDTTTGKLIQSSVATIDDNGVLNLGNSSIGQRLYHYSSGNIKYGLGVDLGGSWKSNLFGATDGANGKISLGFISTSDGSTYTERMTLDYNGNLGISGVVNSGTWQGTSIADTYIAQDSRYKIQVVSIACSDETTDLESGTAKATFRMPFAMTLTAVRASVTTAPSGSTLVVDINESGTTILSTKISIDSTEKTSTTAATPPVISDSSLADDAEITVDIDQVGATTAGTGLKIYLIGYKS